MTDNRFPDWPNDRIDARFPEPGVDARFPDWPADRVDARFLEPGFDTRFEGDVYGSPRIITATITPALGPLTDGDNLFAALSTDALEASNYASTAGTISTVTPAWTLNSSPASPDGSTTVEAGQVWALTITVVDSEANERPFSAGSRTVAAAPPVTDDFLLLESGDALLLENGDKLILEAA